VKALTFQKASIAAGQLFGHILRRDSDPAGYDYAVNRLVQGETSVRGLVKEFCSSEEFREIHVMNQTPNELARRILLILERKNNPKPADIKALAIRLLQEDWRTVIRAVVDSAAYNLAYGDEGIPKWEV
jgi:hypothetical protein